MPVHIRKILQQPVREDSVLVIQELITGHQRDTGVDQGRHISEAEDFRTFDIEILGQKYDGDADDIDGQDQQDGQLQGIQEETGHVAGKEEPDDRKGVRVSGRVLRGEDGGQRVKTGKHHEAQEKVHEQDTCENAPEFPKTVFMLCADRSLHETHLLQ